MINEIKLNNLVCLNCGSSLETSDLKDTITCYECSEIFPVVDGIPILINEKKSIFTKSDFLEGKDLFFDLSKAGKVKFFLSKIIPPNSYNWTAKRNYKYLSELVKNDDNPQKKILVIGASVEGAGFKSFLKSLPNSDIVESDVSFGKKTQIIFDCQAIPYADNFFDCVIAQAVLEHVVNPEICVGEIYRVLKSHGYVYIETPFMQQVHGGPYDFTRWTHSGHRRLLNKFIEIKSGPTAGPGTVLLWTYEYLLLSILGFSNLMRLFIKTFARITGFLFPFLDFLSMWNTKSKDAASGLFFLGRKSDTIFNDKELIQYYNK